MGDYHVIPKITFGFVFTTLVIADIGVTSTGVADSFIKASHFTRRRRAHQIIATSPYILQQRAYSKYKEALDNGVEPLDFKEHPQFLYCCRVLELELCVLQLAHSLTESNFKHCIESRG